ncbi:hypothetical protein MRX96_022955 [Rhipicephalus microplus]
MASCNHDDNEDCRLVVATSAASVGAFPARTLRGRGSRALRCIPFEVYSKCVTCPRCPSRSQMHGYDTGDPGCMGVLPLGAGGHYLCPDDGLGAPPSNLSSHHSSHLPGTPSELSSPTSE